MGVRVSKTTTAALGTEEASVPMSECFNPTFARSLAPCSMCRHFWPAPEHHPFAGRCRLWRRWLTQERQCYRYDMEREERRQVWRRESAGKTDDRKETGQHWTG